MLLWFLSPRKQRKMKFDHGAVYLIAAILLARCQATAFIATREINTAGLSASLSLNFSSRNVPGQLDFTFINQGVCPPSLCKTSDDSGLGGPNGPKGTGDSIFFQGDIVLDKTLRRAIFPSKLLPRHRRAITLDKNRLWKNGVVVYQMDKYISANSKQALMAAMRHISNYTCITFREKDSSHKDYIRFTSEPGCWSLIGRVGGEQQVNIGQGCENLGTASHELLHALGVWHEQARPDRNSYIHVLYQNVINGLSHNFDVVSDTVVSSLQHPYDYLSVMHYNPYAFSKNGNPTIKVIGIGERLKLPIGQRTSLSVIDVSQLRDMYGCNKKLDDALNVCPSGWLKYKRKCYKFFDQSREQFLRAHKTCQGLNGHLVVVDNKGVNGFITKQSNKLFRNVFTWLTAGKLVNRRMVWYLNESATVPLSNYSNWLIGHPGSFTSILLTRQAKTGEFKWAGEWAESPSRIGENRHPFICEAPVRQKCHQGLYTDGRDYRGHLDHTREGHTCQKWTDSYPHSNHLVSYSRDWAASKSRTSPDGLGDHNKCRNPDRLRRIRPWCYTAKNTPEWGFCDVSICSKPAVKPASTSLPIVPRTRPTANPNVLTTRRPISKPRILTTKRSVVLPLPTTKRPHGGLHIPPTKPPFIKPVATKRHPIVSYMHTTKKRLVPTRRPDIKISIPSLHGFNRFSSVGTFIYITTNTSHSSALSTNSSHKYWHRVHGGKTHSRGPRETLFITSRNHRKNKQD